MAAQVSSLSSSASASTAKSVLSGELLTKVVVNYLTVSDVSRCAAVCRDWALWAATGGLKEAISRGHILPEERPFLWEGCAGVASLQRRFRQRGHGHTAQEIYDHYSKIKLSASLEGEISRDVPRTFPNDEFFASQDGREKLRRVLHAVVAAEPGIGYCQGMNFVVGVFLMNLNHCEVRSFWMMLALCYHFDYRQLFMPGVPLLPLRLAQFSDVVKSRMPKLWCHLSANCFSVDVLAQQWVMTLYAYYLAPEALVRVWDAFFFSGWKAIVKAGLAILHSIEDTLLDMDVEGISMYMQRNKRTRLEHLPDIRVLWGHKATNSELYDLARQFQSARFKEFIEDYIPDNLTLAHVTENKPFKRGEINRQRSPSQHIKSIKKKVSSGMGLRSKNSTGRNSTDSSNGLTKNKSLEIPESSVPSPTLSNAEAAMPEKTLPGFSIKYAAAIGAERDYVKVDMCAMCTYNRPMERALHCKQIDGGTGGPSRSTRELVGVARMPNLALKTYTDDALIEKLTNSNTSDLLREASHGPYLWIPLLALRSLQAELKFVDKQVSKDVASLMEKLTELDQKLSPIQKEHSKFQKQLQMLEEERDDLLERKDMLMQTLQAAVETSHVKRDPSKELRSESSSSVGKKKTDFASKAKAVFGYAKENLERLKKEVQGQRNSDDVDKIMSQCHEKVKKIESQFHDISSQHKATLIKSEPIRTEVAELRMVKTQYMQQIQVYLDETAKQCDALIWNTVTIASSLDDPTMPDFGRLSTTSESASEANSETSLSRAVSLSSRRGTGETGNI